MADEKQKTPKDNTPTKDGLEFSDNAILDDVQANEHAELGANNSEDDAVLSNRVEVHTIGLSRGKKLLLSLLLILVLAAIAWLYIQKTDSKKPVVPKSTSTQQAAAVEGATISIISSGVSPANVSVKKGQIVVWKNDDKVAHQIAADPYPTNTSLPELGRGEVLQPGDTFSFIYEKSGTFTYHDNLNPYTIKGVVVVSE